MDLSEYLHGGYYITKLVSRPEWVSLLMPESLLTLSDCLTEVAPGEWTLDWYNYSLQEREEEASKFGIQRERVPELVEFVSAETKGHFHNAFPSAEVAVEFHRRFVRAPDALVIGIGLHKTLVSSFKDQLDKDPNRGLGLLERLEQQVSIARGDAVLGFELLGYSAIKFHSWICNSLPEAVDKALAIRPATNGLLATLEDAVRANEYITQPKNAEPAIWEPWLVVQYAP
jgi:hypothetical protein